METRPRLPRRKFLIRAATEREREDSLWFLCVCVGGKDNLLLKLLVSYLYPGCHTLGAIEALRYKPTLRGARDEDNAEQEEEN